MRIVELLLLNLDSELRGTRATLERIPETGADFTPHGKSMPMGRLAVHVARLPQFLTLILSTPGLDLAAATWPPLVFESREKLLAEFDALAAEARQALAAAGDEQLDQPWTLSWGGKVLTRQPRAQLFSSLFLHHLVHHRAQLGVYLRLNNLPVPSVYGPTADEGMGH